MRSIENETRLTMNTRRNFVNYATMTLSDGTVLNLTPSDFRISGQSFTDDWSDGEAFQVGTAIGKTATLLLDNTDGREEEIGSSTVRYPHGKFSQYDFYMAYFVLYVCLPDAYTYGSSIMDQMIPIGTFTVTTPVANSSTIEITGVDNMYMFDKSFDDVGLDFSVSTGWTIKEILNAVCTYCGVAIGYTTFDNETIRIYEKPENITCRQAVSYIAQIAGCNAVISETGALVLKWYNTSAFASWLDGGTFDTDTTPYSDGDIADGGNFNPWNTGYVADGGDFSTPLPFHNLKQIKATQVSTDDIQFTGVNIKNGEVEVHYPSATGWDTYTLEISDNPFVKDNESIIAEFLYNRLKNIIIRPFTCSSLQDPTIEAGDAALVYDTKGNTYFTVVTNVTFTTGSYTEVSCRAEAPIKQGSRYANSQGVIQLERRTDDYNKQVAHFNEIANAALGYYKTTEVDSQTGAITTYLHDQPTLASSTNIVKIASGVIAISDDGGISWNEGLDISTGTLLLNLVYVHGLTSDWIRTGTLDVGGLNNEDGIIRVTNRSNAGSSVTMTGTNTYIYMYIGPSQIDKSGTYKIFYNLYDFESGKPQKVWCKVQKRDKWGGTTYTWQVVQDWYVVTDFTGELPLLFDVDITDGDMYYYIQFSRSSTDNALFSGALFYNKINTIIDKSGVNTSMLTADGGKIAGYTIDHPIYGHGLFYNENNIYAEYSVNKMHIGAHQDGSWTYCATSNGGAFLHIDYGASGDANGLWISANGANDPYNFDTPVMHINTNSVSCSSHGEVQWSGSDKKLKKDIKNLTLKKAKELIFSVLPREFEFKKTKGKRYGFIAQEVREILPEDSGIEFETEGIKNINYNDFIAPLCMIVKDQQKQIDTLKQRIDKLETIVNTK